MIRPEHKQRLLDPKTTAALLSIRNDIEAKSEGVSALAARQAARDVLNASRVRQALALGRRERLESTLEAGRRAPDRTYWVRPLGQVGQSFWDDAGLRAWFRGGATGVGGVDYGGPPLGVTTGASGYTTTDRGPPPLANPFDATTVQPPPRELALNNARARALAQWRATANGAHWSDRNALLTVERAAAGEMLTATGYHPSQVVAGRPFLSRPAEEDAWRFRAPPPRELRETMETARTEAARHAIGAPASTRVTAHAMLSTRPIDYGFALQGAEGGPASCKTVRREAA